MIKYFFLGALGGLAFIVIIVILSKSISNNKRQPPPPVKEYTIKGMDYAIIEGHLVNLTHDSMMCHSKVILQYSTLVRQ